MYDEVLSLDVPEKATWIANGQFLVVVAKQPRMWNYKDGWKIWKDGEAFITDHRKNDIVNIWVGNYKGASKSLMARMDTKVNLCAREGSKGNFISSKYNIMSGWLKWLERWAAVAEGGGSNLTGGRMICYRDWMSDTSRLSCDIFQH